MSEVKVLSFGEVPIAIGIGEARMHIVINNKPDIHIFADTIEQL